MAYNKYNNNNNYNKNYQQRQQHQNRDGAKQKPDHYIVAQLRGNPDAEPIFLGALWPSKNPTSRSKSLSLNTYNTDPDAIRAVIEDLLLPPEQRQYWVNVTHFGTPAKHGSKQRGPVAQRQRLPFKRDHIAEEAVEATDTSGEDVEGQVF